MAQGPRSLGAMSLRAGPAGGGDYLHVEDLEAQGLKVPLQSRGSSRNSVMKLEEDSFVPGDQESASEESGEQGQPKNPPVCAQGAAHYLRTTLTELLLGSKMNVLLLFTPFAFVASYSGWDDVYVFTFALLALVPFAERVSFVTEDVAKYTNHTIGGLLNASFGNVTELVISVYALRGGLIRVVQVSMLGSVLSNLLLVLGSAFLVGGMRHKEQKFNKVAAVTNSGLLIIAVLALSLPSILDATHEGTGTPVRATPAPAPATRQLGLLLGHVNASEVPLASGALAAQSGPSWLFGNGSLETETLQGGDAPLWLSRFIAAVMLVLYGLLILFQLETHTYIFEGGEDEDDEDEGPGILGFWGGVFWLGVITLFITSLSDMIVDTIVGAARGLGVPILFLSGILVPIVGNAAEHAAAVIFAYKNKMEICLGSAVGSAVQISVLVIPLCVMFGWALGQPMTLNFHIFETAVLLIACIGCSFVLMDGRSHWLKGVILIFSYLMIAAAFWAHADPENMS